MLFASQVALIYDSCGACLAKTAKPALCSWVFVFCRFMRERFGRTSVVTSGLSHGKATDSGLPSVAIDGELAVDECANLSASLSDWVRHGGQTCVACFLPSVVEKANASKERWKEKVEEQRFVPCLCQKYYQVTMAIHWSSRWTGGLWRGPLLSNRGVLNQSFTFTFAVLYILRAAVQKKVYSVGFTPRYHQRPL